MSRMSINGGSVESGAGKYEETKLSYSSMITPNPYGGMPSADPIVVN